MPGNLQPLDEKFAIVTPDGRPTLYFIQWAQQRQIDITDGITLQDLIDYLTAHQLQEGSGIQITPSGDLNDSPTIAADVQEILDQVAGSVQGAILYRNASDWVTLAPGTAGQFLKTNGAGANPAWATVSGGGGSEVLIDSQTVAASATPIVFDNTKITNAYPVYTIKFYGVYGSGASTNLLVQGSPDNGTTWRTTGYSGSRNIWQINGAGTFAQRGSTGTAGLPMLYDVNNDATLPNFGEMHIQEPTNAAFKKMSWCKGATRNGDGNPYMHDAGGTYNTAEAWNALRIIIGAGNLTGTFKLYGLA